MIASALVGHTGFVGQNLLCQRRFDLCVNRANLDALQDLRVGRLVLSALPAQKWLANRHPEDDLSNMRRLQRALLGVEADEVVLISTVDVYPKPQDVDEDDPVPRGQGAPYGQHRFEFEQWVLERYERCTIVRLPGLFGPGLRKNALHDLLNGHEVERLHADARLQWYPIDRLADDIDRAIALRLGLVNAAVEPLALADIAQRHFPEHRIAAAPAGVEPANYRMRSRHADAFGGSDGFWMSAGEVMEAIGRWRRLPDATAMQLPMQEPA